MSDGVLIVAHQYWPEPGPASQRLGALATALLAGGTQVHVITSSEAPSGESVLEGPRGEQVYFTSASRAAGAGFRRVLALLSFANAVRKVGRGLDFSIVVSDPPPTAAWAARRLARLKSASFVYYLCDTWGGATKDSSSVLARLAHPFVKWLEDRSLRASDLVVAVTEKMRDIATQAGAKNVLLAHNGADLATFHEIGPSWDRADITAKPYFLYAGNAGVLQGAEVFAKAAASLWQSGNDFNLVFMGSGADMPKLRQHQREWPDRFWVLDPTPTPEVAAALRGAVGSLASLRPFPSFEDARPTKTMVGLAAGCPAVYAGSGAFAEELRANGLGYISDWSVDGAVDSMRGRAHDTYTITRGRTKNAPALRPVRERPFRSIRRRASSCRSYRARGKPRWRNQVSNEGLGERAKCRVTYVSSAHRWSDNRVHFREAKALADAGYPVTLIAVDHDITLPETKVHVVRLQRMGRLRRFTLGSILAVLKAFKSHPEIVHLHDPELVWSILLFRIFGKTVIYDAHEDLPAQVLGKHYLPRRLMGVAVAAAKAVVSASKLSNHIVAATEMIAERYNSPHVTVVHNYPPLRARDETAKPLSERLPVAVYVGGLTTTRGALEMVHAAAQPSFPQGWEISIAGSMTPESLLPTLEDEPGWERVTYHGIVGPDAARDLLLESRVGLVVLQDSKAYRESLPTKMFEYMAAGIPSIASDFPLWRNIVERHNCGTLVDESSPSAIAEAVKRYQENPELLAEHGENARRAAHAEFNWDSEATVLIALYDSLRSRRAGG